MAGGWRPGPRLDGCFDVDLESSSMTNTLPVHRLGLAPGAAAEHLLVVDYPGIAVRQS